MNKVIGVKFKDSGKIYYFDPLELEIEKGGNVIVETARGLVFGEVAEPPRIIAEESIVAPLKPVVRVATDEDREQHEYYLSKEKEAFKTCQRKIEEHGLAMKLVDVEYAFNGSKLSFYFTADNRVDFRELVKDLAGIFKTRIDLRQIGVRDEAKKCGGIGACGRPVCCSSFLTEFIPVSIKMAKSQNLSLNPTKISGICGRLMCCLKYEQECYDIMHKQMPTVGTECVTVDGSGVVIENNVITERTKVKVTLADGTLDVRSYPFNELNYVNKNGVRCCCTTPRPHPKQRDKGTSPRSGQLQNPTPQTKPKKKQSLLMNLNTTELIFIRTMNFIPMKRKRVTENCLPQSLQNM
jgi:cell fate regulator YaaT (PSP1 superfamily)